MAASDVGRRPDRRGRADRRPDVRRQLDRGLEGDQRIGHGAQARSRRGLHRSLLGDADCDRLLRRRRAVDGELYARDPRSTAKRAEAYLKTTGIGDTVYVGPEAEFFMFDNVQFDTNYASSYFKIDDIELPTNTGREYEGGNLGPGRAPRAAISRSRRSTAPSTSAARWSRDMLEMGLPCDKHHHEVAAAQHELGLTFGTLTTTADRMQIYKYVVHQVAHAYGKSATFMPKPIKEDNGSGMHTHFSIWNGKTPLFAVRAMPACRTCASTSSAASSVTPRRSTPLPTRPPTATSGWCRVTKRRCCSPIRRATARLVPHPPTAPVRRQSASRCASRTRWPTPISLMRR